MWPRTCTREHEHELRCDIFLFSIKVLMKQLSLYSPSIMSKSHHFRGIGQYSEQLMDRAVGWPVFAGRGQKPSNKAVFAATASGSFCSPAERRLCSCGWHTKAAATALSSTSSTTLSSGRSITAAADPPKVAGTGPVPTSLTGVTFNHLPSVS